MENISIAVISSITALCAVLIGPLVALWAANIQTRVAVLSNNRQTWINNLRDAISEFSSTVRMLGLTEDPSVRFKMVERIAYLEAKIKLFLNASEDDHKKLIELVVDARTATIKRLDQAKDSEQATSFLDKMKSSLDELTDVSQRVLKREWERVKKVK